MMRTTSTAEDNDENDDNDISRSEKSMSISDQSVQVIEDSNAEDESGEEDAVFDVETILAQKEDTEGNLEYLVKWDGYDVMNATWEPEDSFNSTDTLMDWERKKLDIQSGQQLRFNVEKWKKRLRKIQSDFEFAGKDMVEFNSELNTNIEDFLIPSSTPKRGFAPSITQPRSRVSITSDESSALFVPADSSSSEESVVPLRTRRREPESSFSGPSGSSLKQSAQALSPLPHNPDKAPQKKAAQAQAHEPQLPKPQTSATKAVSSAPKPPVVKQPFVGFGQSAHPRFTRKRGFESQWGRERAPDPDQIQLMKPSEFSKRENYGHMTLDINRTGLDGSALQPSEMRPSATAEASDSVQMSMAPPAKPSSGGVSESYGPTGSRPAERSQSFALHASGQNEPSNSNVPKSPPKERRTSLTDHDRTSRPTAMRNRPRSPEGDSYRRKPVQSRQRSLSPYSRRPMGPIDSYRPGYSGRRSSSRRSRSPEGNVSRIGSRSPPPPIHRRGSMPDPSHNRHPDASERSRPIPLSAEEECIARMPVGVPSDGASFTRTGLFFNPNEVLVHVYFGTNKEYIGPARIIGLPRVVKHELLQTGLKSPDKHQLELWFKDLHTMDELQVLAKTVSYDDTNCNAWLEGFEQTNPRLFRMTEQLRRQKIAAVYNRLDSDVNSWIAYAPASEFDAFLTRRTGAWRFPGNVPICLAVRGTLRQPSILQEEFGPPRRYDENVTSPITLAHTEFLASSITHASRQPLVCQSEPTTSLGRPSRPASGRWGSMSEHTHASSANVHPSDGLPTMNELFDDVRAEASMTDVMPDNHQPVPNSTMTGPALNPAQTGTQMPVAEMFLALNTFFSKLDMTIDRLASCTEKIFYLHFPPGDDDARIEHGMIMAWLQCNNVIYLSNWDKNGQEDKNAWQRFRETYNKGVIIFHESFHAFHDLRPRIRGVQWSFNFNFWHVRIKNPLALSNTRFCKENAHIQRLFPHGTAFLLTDDVFRDMKQVAIILAWFFERRKSTGGASTKLVFQPDVLGYLNRKLDDPARNKDEDPYVWSIISSIKQVNSSFNPAFRYFEPSSMEFQKLDNPNNNVICLPVQGYGTRSESDDPLIPKGLTQEERNADHLVEAFAGWMLAEAARFRKTVVISNHTNKDLMARWPGWGHVNVFDVNSFLKKWQVKEDVLLEKIKTGSKPQDDSPMTPADHTAMTPRIPQTPKTPLESQISRDPRVSARDPRLSRGPRNLDSSTTHTSTAGAASEWKAPGQHGYPGTYQ
ncbi:uncharacterized protein N7483_009759 [Penicillium malachiteum]|uniref:uncharacterized protein n=1 Tax=Penicillium malachiteum TaxID=1324776 RepID=UPI00254698B3|nr:uncharacterized protein N7483_009759 [Penicillium malachiteum]KAJ5721825.1 hypothetical protein N7483_009759 [Penicillium malachiteum]